MQEQRIFINELLYYALAHLLTRNTRKGTGEYVLPALVTVRYCACVGDGLSNDCATFIGPRNRRGDIEIDVPNVHDRGPMPKEARESGKLERKERGWVFCVVTLC